MTTGNTTIHNIVGKGVNSTLELGASEGGLPKPSSIIRDAQGRVLPGSVLNPEGKNATLSQLLRDKGELPCAYVPGMTWKQAIVENEWSQALNDPVARRNLLDRLLGRATESVNLNQSGVVTLRVVHDDYVNPNETKQIAGDLTITKPEDNSAPPDSS